jgi:5-hydroxytryptamine receptor 1
MSGSDFLYASILNSSDNKTKYENLNSIFSEQNDFCSEFFIRCSFISIILGLLIICTIIGNSFVIAAVILERNLHSVANYLIVSLAITDLTVSVMVNRLFFY